MNLKERMDRFYLDMVINELRQANADSCQHISYNSMLYLDIIAYRKNCTVSAIADMLHIARSAVTLKVKELERLGLVHKVQSTEDKRIFYLTVDQKVLDEYKAYDRVLYGALDELEARYAPPQLSTLCDMLDTINRHFQNADKPTERK